MGCRNDRRPALRVGGMTFIRNENYRLERRAKARQRTPLRPVGFVTGGSYYTLNLIHPEFRGTDPNHPCGAENRDIAW